MSEVPEFSLLCATAAGAGLACRGAFHPEASDDVPPLRDGVPTATLVLFGFVRGEQWPAFTRSNEFADRQPGPLDRWSRRLIDALGAPLGARGLYPSDGPPWLPFQRWATKAEAVHVSPLGLLVHPDWGLWHSYRGALALRERWQLPAVDRRPSPCDECAAQPCLSTCPVDAVQPQRFNHRSCALHVGSDDGSDCLHAGCRARRSCPVGQRHRYGDHQAEFHMRAFLRGAEDGERR